MQVNGKPYVPAAIRPIHTEHAVFMPCSCRAHAVPLPCRAANGLERVFPI